MPADKMVSYPMQNNGSLDEEAFFFLHKVPHTAVCQGLCPLETHKLLCTKSQLKLGFNYKKLLFCAVGKWAMFGFFIFGESNFIRFSW